MTGSLCLRRGRRFGMWGAGRATRVTFAARKFHVTAESEGKMPSRQPAGRRRYSRFVRNPVKATSGKEFYGSRPSATLRAGSEGARKIPTQAKSGLEWATREENPRPS